MLRLRKILLHDYLYLIILLLVIIITSIRLLIPKESNYNINSNEFRGIVVKKVLREDYLKIYLKNKEIIITNYYFKNKKDLNKINLGDTLKVQGKFIIPNSNTSKYLFNYNKYLKRNNIYYLVKAHTIIKIRSNRSIYYYLKQKLIKRINNNSYLNTFILGDKSYLDNNVKRSYQNNGISHLFAISGMHITLLVEIIRKLLKRLKLQEEKLFIITSFILLLYLFLVGLSPSILRGVLFYIIFSINNIKYFYIKPINLFILVLSISLLINPNYIFDIGYLYSYSISFALILLSKYLTGNYFISLLKVSIISFLVSIPITLYNFYSINLLSIIYNLFFVPLVSLIIFPLSLIILVIKPLDSIYLELTKLLENISLFLNNISFGKLVFIRLPIVIYIIYFLLIILFLFKPKKIFIIVFFILLIIHYLIPYFNNTSYVEALDVSQGDSTLIHINNKNILIDTGGTYNKGEIVNNRTLPILKSFGINKINYLVITHGDNDHMGDSISLVNSFKVEKVIFNCGEYNDLEKELIKVLNKKKIKYYKCIDKIDDMYFLQTKLYDNENDNSNVIYMEINNYKFLFMGDAGIEKEKDILDNYNLSNIDVLKIGHHGSRTSSSKEFINEINPKYSIISVGKNNRYGHPNKEVLKTLKESKIYRTDKNGSIIFKIKKNKLNIETCTP